MDSRPKSSRVMGSATLPLLHYHGAGEFCHSPDVTFRTPSFQFGSDLLRGHRIPVAGGSDLHRGGSREHELHDIGGSRNSTHADDWNVNRFRGVVHHSQGNGL